MVIPLAADVVGYSRLKSAVEAVQCALDLQRGMFERNASQPDDQRIIFRIGINIGDVIIDDDDDIYGGGVNVAARLEALADPGGILISGTAYDQIEGRVDCGFEFIGEKEVKNIERPVRTYCIDANRSIRSVCKS